MTIRTKAKKFFSEMHRQYWLLRLRMAERRHEKELEDTAAVLRRMCGQAAGPHLEKLYARRIHITSVINTVVGPHKARKDLAVAEIQMVMFEFLMQHLNSHIDEVPA